jgi:hypothetical protein
MNKLTNPNAHTLVGSAVRRTAASFTVVSWNCLSRVRVLCFRGTSIMSLSHGIVIEQARAEVDRCVCEVV